MRGASMEPTLSAGDRLLLSYRRTPAAGSLVVARFPDGVVVVKRADAPRETASGAAGWWLLSDNPDAAGAVDSRARGAIAAGDVLAVVVARLWPRPRRFARGPHRPL
ncbi:S24/S26 family peptidase [Nocardioides sp.]|uniref:S24/S26 family peptidase n=1 Tax=Nocardioides sp. TaxID=35761 RepID=UPI0039C91332